MGDRLRRLFSMSRRRLEEEEEVDESSESDKMRRAQVEYSSLREKVMSMLRAFCFAH